MKEIRVLGVMINNPSKGADKIHSILSTYGCNIRTRLGLHDDSGNYAADTGLMILELSGGLNDCLKLENELLAIEGVDVQKMVFKKE